MKLERRNKYDEEFRCELTRELDDISGILKKGYCEHYRHYILADKYCKAYECLAIRLPGRTVGWIWINNNIITKIFINTDRMVNTYPENVNKLMEKYRGLTIDFDLNAEAKGWNDCIDYFL